MKMGETKFIKLVFFASYLEVPIILFDYILTCYLGLILVLILFCLLMEKSIQQ